MADAKRMETTKRVILSKDSKRGLMVETVHADLPCGIEYAVMPMPQRHIVTFQIRVLAGTCSEPADRLGLAGLVEETLDKGTERRSGRELSDAFDAIGAVTRSGTGRETTTFTCTVLPEHFEKAVALHAEFLRQPTFPNDAVKVAVELARQDLASLEDDAQGLADKLLSRQAYGPVLGRHELGEKDCLDRITRDDLLRHWQSHFSAGNMMVCAAGAIEANRAADVFEKHFQGFGKPERRGRVGYAIEFNPGMTHRQKELEQEQIGICWRGVDATHADFPVQMVTLGILSGGMSGRLFTEVRERLGLVYWVGAYQDTPRGHGMMFVGASTTPDRCDETFKVLLREVDRLAEDIEQEELDRAVTGIIASQDTRGDSTRAHCGELGTDLFHFGRPIPIQEKTAKIQAVSIEDIRRYLKAYPRKQLCVVTLGPRPLSKG